MVAGGDSGGSARRSPMTVSRRTLCGDAFHAGQRRGEDDQRGAARAHGQPRSFPERGQNRCGEERGGERRIVSRHVVVGLERRDADGDGGARRHCPFLHLRQSARGQLHGRQFAAGVEDGDPHAEDRSGPASRRHCAALPGVQTGLMEKRGERPAVHRAGDDVAGQGAVTVRRDPPAVDDSPVRDREREAFGGGEVTDIRGDPPQDDVADRRPDEHETGATPEDPGRDDEARPSMS